MQSHSESIVFNFSGLLHLRYSLHSTDSSALGGRGGEQAVDQHRSKEIYVNFQFFCHYM